tara:strand:- start:1354 stop:1644 length:291 start_codon:yes stop_codon:yes gene_type:complete
MIDVSKVFGEVGSVTVMTTNERGFTPEEIAERALDKIIYIGGNVPPVISDQARAYRERIRLVLVYYMKEAIRSNNVTLVNKLTKAGYPELVRILDI